MAKHDLIDLNYYQKKFCSTFTFACKGDLPVKQAKVNVEVQILFASFFSVSWYDL